MNRRFGQICTVGLLLVFGEYNPVQDDRSDFITHSHVLFKNMKARTCSLST